MSDEITLFLFILIIYILNYHTAWSYKKNRYDCYIHTGNTNQVYDLGFISGDVKTNSMKDTYRYDLPSMITANYVPGVG